MQEVVQGKSLGEMVSAGMRADESEVTRIAQELLVILKYLGSLRPPVIHRDIKPENVVLEGGKWGGRVYLVDFGGVQGAAAAGMPSLTYPLLKPLKLGVSHCMFGGAKHSWLNLVISVAPTPLPACSVPLKLNGPPNLNRSCRHSSAYVALSLSCKG